MAGCPQFIQKGLCVTGAYYAVVTPWPSWHNAGIEVNNRLNRKCCKFWSLGPCQWDWAKEATCMGSVGESIVWIMTLSKVDLYDIIDWYPPPLRSDVTWHSQVYGWRLPILVPVPIPWWALQCMGCGRGVLCCTLLNWLGLWWESWLWQITSFLWGLNLLTHSKLLPLGDIVFMTLYRHI